MTQQPLQTENWNPDTACAEMAALFDLAKSINSRLIYQEEVNDLEITENDTTEVIEGGGHSPNNYHV